MNSVSTVAYPLLFATTAFVFVFASLLLGRFLPKLPVSAKREIYECGEPTIGSSFVQFDLRFYVVALVFIVFEVEAAFFFPWAVVFGDGNSPVRRQSAQGGVDRRPVRLHDKR